MSEERNRLSELISSLKQERDELRVRMHLASQEAKDEWNALEKRYEKLNEDYQPLKNAVGESAGQVVESLKLVAEEIKHGFDRIRKSL